jgi:hypothetical protein
VSPISDPSVVVAKIASRSSLRIDRSLRSMDGPRAAQHSRCDIEGEYVLEI